MTKRILRNLKIKVIAAVDSPCQEHAKVAIMKRADHDHEDEMIDSANRKTRARFKTLTIKELSAVDHPAQEPALAVIMKNQEETMASIAKAQGDFNEVARSIAKRDNVPVYAAMQRARQERPALFAAAYSGRVISVPPPSAMQAPAQSAVSKAAGDFQAKVSEIAARDRCGQHVAMSKARQEAPHLFQAAFGR